MRHVQVLAFLLVAESLLAAPPSIKAPEKVEAKAGEWVALPVTTDSKHPVRFVFPPTLSVFPVEKLKNPNEAYVTGMPGSYKVLAYTGDERGPSDPVVIVVNIVGGDTKPDTLSRDVQALYLKEPLATRSTDRVRLAAVYRATADSVNDLTTAKVAFEAINLATVARIEGRLAPLREAFGGELATILPKAPSTPLTKDHKDSLAAALRRFATILDSLKEQ